MLEEFVASDNTLVDLLREQGSLTVAELAGAMGVTGTAVRQRLQRLLGQQLVEREVTRGGRGRPSHRYRLTDKGRRQAGSNLSDLAAVLWEEVPGSGDADADARQGLLERLAQRLAGMYAGKVRGQSLAERMRSLADLFAERHVPFRVDQAGSLPVLTAVACPYPALAERDRSVCSMERLLVSQLLEQDVRLSGCRLDGQPCCTFQST